MSLTPTNLLFPGNESDADELSQAIDEPDANEPSSPIDKPDADELSQAIDEPDANEPSSPIDKPDADEPSLPSDEPDADEPPFLAALRTSTNDSGPEGSFPSLLPDLDSLIQQQEHSLLLSQLTSGDSLLDPEVADLLSR